MFFLPVPFLTRFLKKFRPIVDSWACFIYIIYGATDNMSENGGLNMKKRISVNPDIHFGKPCITGTRIPVQDVLELVREEVPFEDIISDYYTDIDAEDIQACIQYAIDIITSEEIHITSQAA